MENKDTNNVRKVFKKTSHKGRIFLMCLGIPALALSTTAVIWPSVMSCSNKGSSTDVEVEISTTDATVSKKTMEGDNLVITLEAKDKDNKEVETVEVTKGGQKLSTPDDYTFDVSSQKVTITKQGLAKAGNVVIKPTLSDKWTVDGDAKITKKEFDEEGNLLVSLEANAGKILVDVDKVTRGGQQFRGKEVEFHEDLSMIAISKDALERLSSGAFVITAFVVDEFTTTCEGCSVERYVGYNCLYFTLTPEGEKTIKSIKEVKKGSQLLEEGEEKDYTFDIPSSILYVNKNALKQYSGNLVITAEFDEPTPVVEGLEFEKIDDTTCAVYCPVDEESQPIKLLEGEITIPSKGKCPDGVERIVVAIQEGGFVGQTKITKLTLPNTIKEIGALAFKGIDPQKTLENIDIKQDLNLWDVYGLGQKEPDDTIPLQDGEKGGNAEQLLTNKCKYVKHETENLIAVNYETSPINFKQGEAGVYTAKFVPTIEITEEGKKVVTIVVKYEASKTKLPVIMLPVNKKYLPDDGIIGITSISGDPRYYIKDAAKDETYKITINFNEGDYGTIRAEKAQPAQTITRDDFLEKYQSYLKNLNNETGIFGWSSINKVIWKGKELEYKDVLNAWADPDDMGNNNSLIRLMSLDGGEEQNSSNEWAYYLAGYFTQEQFDKQILPGKDAKNVKYEYDAEDEIITCTQTDSETNEIIVQIQSNKYSWLTKFYLKNYVSYGFDWSIDCNMDAKLLTKPNIEITDQISKGLKIGKIWIDVNEKDDFKLAVNLGYSEKKGAIPKINYVKLNGKGLVKDEDYEIVETDTYSQINFIKHMTLSSDDTITIVADAE